MENKNFHFLTEEYPRLAAYAHLAEQLLYIDPASTLVKLRLASEKITEFIGDYENVELKGMDQSRKIGELGYYRAIPVQIVDVLHRIRKSGNDAAHRGKGDEGKAKLMLHEFFKLSKWFFEVYEDISVGGFYKKPVKVSVKITQEIEVLEGQIDVLEDTIKAYEDKLTQMRLSSSVAIDSRHLKGEEVIARLMETETETREFIDEQLRDTGWICDTDKFNLKLNNTQPMQGRNMAIAEWKCGDRWADYALFIGTQLVGIIEAEKYANQVDINVEKPIEFARKTLNENNAVLIGNCDGVKVPFVFVSNSREDSEGNHGIWYKDTRAMGLSKKLDEWLTPEEIVGMLKDVVSE